MTKCTIKGCNGEAIKKYDLFGNRPHFLTSSLCKKHAEDADKALIRKGLRVLPDGSYTKHISNSDFIITRIKDEIGEKNITIESLRKISHLIQKHERDVRKDIVTALIEGFKKERDTNHEIFLDLERRVEMKCDKESSDNISSLINQVAGSIFALNYVINTMEGHADGTKGKKPKKINYGVRFDGGVFA